MSQTFETIIQNIKDDISDIPERDPVLIYIGVGTYAGLMTIGEDETRFLEPKNYHQYPPFIKELKKMIPNLRVSIVLIDPMQENPPYMVNDRKYTEDEFYEESIDKYVSYDEKIHLYVLRQSVTIGEIYPSHLDSCVNITDALHDLNQFCIQNDISLLYHDFTGRNMKMFAEYFDSSLDENIDRIVYGFGGRADFGCYFDLTSPVARYPVFLERGVKRYFLRFLNLQKFIKSREFYKIDEYLHFENLTLFEKESIREQLNEFIRQIKSNVLNVMIYSLRMIYRLEKGVDTDFNEEFFMRFDERTCHEFIELYRTRQFSRLFRALLEFYSEELDIYARLKNFDVNGYEMLQIITTNPDPYKWCDELKQFSL